VVKDVIAELAIRSESGIVFIVDPVAGQPIISSMGTLLRATDFSVPFGRSS
jgi:hypothetical protein